MAFQDRISYHSNKSVQSIILLIGVIAFVTILYVQHQQHISLQADVFLMFFSAVTLFFLLWEWSSYTPFFLLSTFTALISWRLSSLANYTVITYIYLIMFIFIVAQYFIACKNDVKDQKRGMSGIHLSNYEWQLLFVRMYIGYDLVPHFCEKLFAGDAVRMEDVIAFTNLNVPHPLAFVILAGLIEFAGALSISCGFMTRLGSICLCIYLIVATWMGHHFTLGFIWANQGGGWEYPVLWGALILSFAWNGADAFSIDEVLNENFNLPPWLQWLMGVQRRTPRL